LQIGFFITPVFYRLNVFPDSIKRILELNPMASIIDTAHRIVIYGTLPTLEEALHIVISTLVIFLIGYVVFRTKDKRLVEKI